MRIAAVALILLLAACGGGSGGDAAPTATTPPADQPAAVPTTPAPTGTPVPEALSRFACDPDGAGTYTASGTLKNATKKAVTFQVTVYVGQPTTEPGKGRTQQVPRVAAGGSTKFEIVQVPAAAEGGTCFVQVVTTG